MSSNLNNLVRSATSALTTRSQRLSRLAPEPKSRLQFNFRSLMQGIGSAASTAASTAGSAIGINPEYMELINRQIEVQTQMQLVTTVSNIEKSKHETAQKVTQNMRA